ncbi:ribonuclease H-like domain-containing protein [Tanacetum coccineum]
MALGYLYQVLQVLIWFALFKHKFHADGTLSHYKARLVANGSSQQLGVDFDETFSPVVKPATIHTVFSLAVSRKWPIHQLDVKNAFLNGDLSETIYMHQPPSFVDVRYPNHVCRLHRSLYGLKLAPHAWFQRFAGYATWAGFYHSHCDSSLFIYRQGSQVAYLFLYVDHIILTDSSTTILQHLIDSLHHEFDMADLGELNYFLGVPAIRHSTGLFERAHMVNCNPSRTPVDTESKLGPDGVPVQDPTLYQSCPSTCSAEAEYRDVVNVVAETAWLRNLLRELHSPLSTATLVYYDNIMPPRMTTRTHGGIDEVPDFSMVIAQQLQNLLPTIIAQVGNHVNSQRNNGNQNDKVVNDNIQGDVRNVNVNNNQGGYSYKEFLACNPKEFNGKGSAIVYTCRTEKMELVQDMSGRGDN